MDLASRPELRDPHTRSRPSLVRSWSPGVALASLLALAMCPWGSTGGQEEPRPRLVLASATVPARASTPDRSIAAGPAETSDPALDAILRARRVIADCKARFAEVDDYTCTFHKRERVDGKLYTPHIISMKARTEPSSLYFKFHQPNRGREAIFIEGQNDGKIVAHDVGLGRFLAGTMYLDPNGTMAMEENRHPVTEAGLGSMIDTVRRRWDSELSPGESEVDFDPEARVDDRPCLMVETTHPGRGEGFLFHKVKLYVDRELGLPTRFEAYDWPAQPGAEPDLVEEYTFRDLKINVGLKDDDFDPENRLYSFGRF